MNIENHLESAERGFVIRNFTKILILLAGISLFTSGCVTLGKDFPEANVSVIKIGQTTKNEIRKLFGSPWLSGINDGELAGLTEIMIILFLVKGRQRILSFSLIKKV